MKRRGLLLGAASIGFASASRGAARTLASFGARGNGDADDTAALVRALTDYEGDLVIAAGTYRYARTLQLRGSGRSIRFEPGAVLMGDDPSVSGLEIRQATGVTLAGASLAWRREPRQRIRFGAGVLVMGGADVRVERVRVEGFEGAGLLFESCQRPVVSGARVRKTSADGVHFANCGQSLAEDIDCQDTGDDGLAFVNYRRLPDASGGTARRIVVTNSNARGITVVGQSDVNVSEFRITRTRGSGIYVAQEDSYATRFPHNAVFERGTVDQAGAIEGRAGNKCGAELVRAHNARLSSITISHSRSRLVGVNGATGTLRMSNLTLRDNTDGEGVYIQASEQVQMNDCRVTNAFNTGLYAKDLQMLEVSGVELEACAERGASRTAVWLENVRDLRARFGKVEASPGMASPARVVLRGIGAGALSVPSASAGRRVSVMAEESPTLGVELR
ncbi:MAG: right-handed parallel beta-helix repeat-containing protein [Rhizobacter sp.]|nr:right-handed parallel beta-helix repeat-containing protein [Rhizobacter sp.]